MKHTTCPKGHPVPAAPWYLWCQTCDAEDAQRTRRAQYGFEWVDGPEKLRTAMMLEV